MKEVRFGSIAEEYEKNGEAKTAWNPAGFKAMIDWENRKLSVQDVRTGKWIFFGEKKEKTERVHKSDVPEIDDEMSPDTEIPF